MHGRALLLQPLALTDAEAVLLVDDRQVQPVEGHVVLEERMSPDRDLCGA